LTNVYSGQPPAVTIEVPLVALVLDNAAVMPLTAVGAGPVTGGQYAKHAAEQAECPGLSAVSMYTVNPLPSTRTGPSDVVATPRTPPGAAAGAVAGAPVAAELAEVVVLVPHAVASMRVAAAPSRLTVIVERDIVTSQ
jgi:hypothetical protein